MRFRLTAKQYIFGAIVAGMANLLLGISIEYLVFYFSKQKDLYEKPNDLNILATFLTGVVLFMISEHILYITNGKECVNL